MNLAPAILAASIAASALPTGVMAAPADRSAIAGPIAVFPVENLTGKAVSVRNAEAILREALEAVSIPLLESGRLEEFFDGRRVRYTGGMSRAIAALLNEDLDIPVALIPSLDLWDPGEPPRVAMTARLVTAGETPVVVWMDSVTVAGDEAPGFFELGLVRDPDAVLTEVVRRLVASLVDWRVSPPDRVKLDEGPRRFRPRRLFVAPEPPGEAGRPVRVAVVPFTSRVSRRGAGEIVQLQFVRHLALRPEFEVVEPGVVRQVLLDVRIIPARGVSLAQADLLKQFLQVDLVVSGNIYEFTDGGSMSGETRADLSLVALDTARRSVAWTAFSGAAGSGGLNLFELGRLRSGAAVTDALSRAIVVAAARAKKGSR